MKNILKNKKNLVIILLAAIILVTYIPVFFPPKDPIEQMKETLQKETERLQKENDEKEQELRSEFTPEQRRAIEMAEEYLEFASFSREGLTDQLIYEGFDYEVANFATASLYVDWYEQAYLSAKNYLEFQSFSKSGLIEQLEYEGFGHKEAVYGANKAYN